MEVLIEVTTPVLSMLLCGLTFPLGGKDASQMHSFSSEIGEFSVFWEGRGIENGDCGVVRVSRSERSSRNGPLF